MEQECKHHLSTLHILNHVLHAEGLLWIGIFNNPVFFLVTWENSPSSFHLSFMPQNSRINPQACSPQYKLVNFPWFRHYFLKSAWGRFVFTPVLIFCLEISFSEGSFGFQLGMKKGKLAIIIRIKLKLITQSMSIYLWIWQKCTEDLQCKTYCMAGKIILDPEASMHSIWAHGRHHALIMALIPVEPRYVLVSGYLSSPKKLSSNQSVSLRRKTQFPILFDGETKANQPLRN